MAEYYMGWDIMYWTTSEIAGFSFNAAQIILALALAYYTMKLYKSTKSYSKIAEEQTRILNENNKRESLNKELSLVVGPLYAKIGDEYMFNNKIIPPKYTELGGEAGKYDDKNREIATFWHEIKTYKYMTSQNLSDKLENYLKIKQDSVSQDRYEACERELMEAIEERYKQATNELNNFNSRN